MKAFLSILGLGLLTLALLTGVAWFAQGSDFFLYQYFAPKYANVQRKVFVQTYSYNQGMVQNLQKMQFEYVQASAANKPALAAVILDEYGAYDETQLPPDQQEFMDQLKSTRGSGSP